jgi:ubiquinone/menaquinone biosynthesis C-methylase UbiE
MSRFFEAAKKHLGFVKHLDEFRFKRWLDRNASQFLTKVGVMAGQEVLDFGCGSGTYTIPVGKLVGEAGRVYALDISVTALAVDGKVVFLSDVFPLFRIGLLGF